MCRWALPRWVVGVVLLGLLSLPAPSSAATVTDDYIRDITADYDRISDTLNGELAKAFGFYSTLGWPDGPGSLDLLKGPRIEFGGGVGADLVRVDVNSIPLSVLASDSNVDIPELLPLPYPVWHGRVGLLKGLDFGIRGTGYPRIHKDQISTANRGVGFALRYQALGGLTKPEVSIQITWDRMKGDASFATDIDQRENYNDGGVDYLSTLQGRVVYQEIWDVRSFGVKVMVGKKIGIFHPFGAIGLQRHAGRVESRLTMDLTARVGANPEEKVAKILTRHAEPPITQPKFMAGFDLGEGFYWSNLFESNGRDIAFSTGFRFEI